MTKPTRTQVEKAAREMYAAVSCQGSIAGARKMFRKFKWLKKHWESIARWHLARVAEALKESRPWMEWTTIKPTKSPATKAKKGRAR